MSNYHLPLTSYFYRIKVLGPYREVIEEKHYSQLRWDIYKKWDWYFKYRAALLQVKYPKCEVVCSWGPEMPNKKTEAQLLANKLRAKKGKLTQWKNSIEKFKKNWVSLFPIEDDKDYQKALQKIQSLEFEINLLEGQLNSL